MSEIIKNKLYLGDMFDANDATDINGKNISCIISVAERLKIINTNPLVTVHNYELSDDYNCNISLYFDEIGEIIHKAGVVLVNCAAGISRSSSLVIAYLMIENRWLYEEAYNYVKSKRSIINPNIGFVKQLKALEYRLKMY